MSWFADFAGKAEDLLNRVDKTAAVALHKSELESGTLVTHIPSSSEQDSKPAFREIKKQLHSSAPSTPLTVRQNTSKSSSYSPPPTKTKNKTDDQLLEFLNAPTGREQVKQRAVPNQGPINPPVPNNPQIEQLTVKQEDYVQEVPQIPEKPADLEMPETMQSVPDNATTEEELSSDEVALDIPELTSDEPATNPDHSTEDLENQQHSTPQNTFEQENILLKNEIRSLSKEIEIIGQRSKESDGENKRLKKQLEHWNSQISGSENIIRELRDRENDFATALKAKDSQLAVLRIRLQESDQERNSHKERAELLKTENERLYNEHVNVSGVHNDALENLRLKCLEAETALRHEQETRKKAEMEAFQQYSSLEEEKSQLMENISLAQRQLSEQKSQTKELSQQLRSSRLALDTARQDLSDYRQKAQRILQSKEKLICTLKENRSMEISDEAFSETDASTKSLSDADDTIQRENDSLREELRQSQELCENLRAELRDMEHNLQADSYSWKEKVRTVEDSLKQERIKREEVDSELTQLKEELKYMREDLTHTKANMQSRIKDRDLEVEKLRRQLTTKSLSQSSQSELETRIRTLTENLIQKQTLVEALSTEKNSLVMQMERLEQKMKDFQVPSSRSGSAHIVGITEDGLKNRLPGVFNESPYDSNMTRRVKRAYGAIDSFSIRMGSFLRRYPASRAFLLSYMVMLHLWVFAVLITYQPEIHGKLP